jgi:hypothetical protein
MHKAHKPLKAHGARTNATSGSLVKVVVQEDEGRWKRPNHAEIFYIDETASFPKIEFEIELENASGLEWSWVLSWPAAVSGLKESEKRGRIIKTFSEKSAFKQDSTKWTADLGDKSIGGILAVQVKNGNETFKRSVRILGKNPREQDVMEFLSKIDDVKGIEKLFAQESGFKNFINHDGQPIVSFDGGYGLTQITNPPPSYVQVWNWKENIKAAIGLYKAKQVTAKAYLSKQKRTYTDEQLKLETWSLWNGGNYHVWDEKSHSWIRNPNILADTQTGNIGWDITNDDNKGKTEAELHERDKNEYKKPPEKDKRSWIYSGVCYADHINK